MPQVMRVTSKTSVVFDREVWVNSADDVRGIGIGVPAPVAFSRGEPVAPPMMPGWDGFSIPGWFSRHYDAPVLVDNDVNIMALGEHWTHWRDTEHLLYVKIGTGIGCGIVSGRRIHRGALGARGTSGTCGWRGTTTSSAAAGTVEHVLAPETVDRAIQAYVSAATRRRQPSH
jgi:predicted NBD/HSP70 family sugar kinase